MSTVFVLQNQFKHLLNKQKGWVSGREARSLYYTAHKDEAINQMFEVSSKDYTQRVKLLSCELSEKRLPIVQAEDLPNLEDFETQLEIEVDTPIESTDVEENKPESTPLIP